MNLLQEILKTLSLPEFYFAMFRSATPVLLTTLGAMISSRSGTSNIALEGTMLISAFVGVVVSAFSHSAWIGFLGAVFAGFVVSNILAYFILKLNSNAEVARASAEVKVGDVIEVAFGTKAVKVRVTSVQETIRKEDTKEMFEYI